MYKVLLVDDEPWVIEELKNLTDWKSMGFEIIGEARNGVEAISIIKRQNPDLIFSDIKMPEMNGIEMIDNVKKLNRQNLIVFISAYSEFEYCRQAIDYGAFNYLLKPVEKEKIDEVLSNALVKLKEFKEMFSDKIRLALIDIINDITDQKFVESAVKRLITNLKFRIAGRSCYLGIIKIKVPPSEIDKSKNLNDFYIIPAGKSRFMFLYIAPKKNSITTIKNMLRIYKRNSVVIGVSRAFKIGGAEEFINALNQANIMADQDFIVGINRAYLYHAQNTPALNAYFNKIRTLNTKEEISDELKLLPKMIKKLKVNTEGLNKLYNEILSLSSQNAADLKSTDQKELINKFSDIEQLIKTLEDTLNTVYSEETGISSNEVVKETIEYIKKNYDKKIMINNIAKDLFLNPNYLGILFKNETGKSFTAYLIELRLQHAVEFLKDDKLSLYEVSEKVGYDDYFHFSKLFKKHKKVSPSEFRKNNSFFNRD